VLRKSVASATSSKVGKDSKGRERNDRLRSVCV
jgi:hypothetical protein